MTPVRECATDCFKASMRERWHAQPPGVQKSKCLIGLFLGPHVVFVTIRMHDNLKDAGIQVTTPGREIRQTQKQHFPLENCNFSSSPTHISISS